MAIKSKICCKKNNNDTWCQSNECVWSLLAERDIVILNRYTEIEWKTKQKNTI